jgi:hypothetical protein
MSLNPFARASTGHSCCALPRFAASRALPHGCSCCQAKAEVGRPARPLLPLVQPRRLDVTWCGRLHSCECWSRRELAKGRTHLPAPDGGRLRSGRWRAQRRSPRDPGRRGRRGRTRRHTTSPAHPSGRRVRRFPAPVGAATALGERPHLGGRRSTVWSCPARRSACLPQRLDEFGSGELSRVPSG